MALWNGNSKGIRFVKIFAIVRIAGECARSESESGSESDSREFRVISPEN